jgi:SAM-dependent methyltransferase
MPSLEWNRNVWNATYNWDRGGDEWSSLWGGAAAQWYGSLLPRIHRWVPAGTILEIAPGFGRWTQFLIGLAERLIVVDLSEKCVAACRERFAAARNVSYHVNDGRSLGAVPDKSVGFAFSFDSFVHVEADVLECYIAELSRTLTPDGTAFLHHSNIGAYAGSVSNPHMRADSVRADVIVAACSKVGLECISQELVTWGGDATVLSDCFSVLTPAGSVWAQENQIIRNPEFMAEASRSSARESLYRVDAPAAVATDRANPTRPYPESR